MADLYVVLGSAGEYSDWEQWTVVAYSDEQMARTHAERATVAARWRREAVREIRYDTAACEAWGAAHPNVWDTTGECDDAYDNANYTVSKIKLRTQLPEEAPDGGK